MSLQDKIKKIIKVIENTNIEEIEISSFWGAQKIRLSKKKSVFHTNGPIDPQPVNVKQNYSDETIIVDDPENNNDIDTKEDSNKSSTQKSTGIDESSSKDNSDNIASVDEEDLEYQKAPLVGTFYASSKPGEPPFVKVGDKISKGQIICIIEAMKIFNEIESDFDGVVVEILAEDANPVEFNQAILSIKPTE